MPALAPLLAVIACLLLLQAPPVRGASTTVLNIVPGPRSMTPEEKALAPDPSDGSGAGIILLEETDRNDGSGRESRISYHFRAKIFSAEGADLGLVQIPLERSEGALLKWWGWTLLPDGSIRELAEAQLKAKPVLRAGRTQAGILSAQLPVEPGCVIDYGYVVEERSFEEWQTVDLRREVPLRELRYRWTPGGGYPGTYRLPRDHGLSVSAVRDGRSVLITARNLPALIREPWMPPERVVRAAVALYYHASAASEDDYWRGVAKRLGRAAAYFCQEKPVRQAVASMSLPASADLGGRLKLAYEWMLAHVRNVDRVPLQEVLARPGAWEVPEGLRAQEVLDKGLGDCRHLTYLYWGIARALGAQADFVPVPDRRRRYFDPGLLTISQFSRVLVAVRAPGAPKEAMTLVDVCTGLPYGDAPWWFTGIESILLGQDGAEEVMLFPEPGGGNVSVTEARILFREDRTESIRWTLTGRRQQHLAERLDMLQAGPAERKQRLDRLCGAGGPFKVLEAGETGVDDLGAPFRIECEAGLEGASPDSTIAAFRARFAGPWIPAVLEFPAPGRVNPVVLDFPRLDQAGIDVTAPAGFAPSGAPPSVRMETPYGHYALFVTAGTDGYRVERVFSLSPTAPVPVGEYGALRDFLTAVSRADQTLLEFRRPGPAAAP